MSAKHRRIAVIPGDGIGPDVTRQAVRVLEAALEAEGESLALEWFDYGAERYLADGTTLPKADFERLRDNFDGALLGALGDPRIPDMTHIKEILLGLRFGMDLFVNFRPVELLDARFCPIKDKRTEDVQILVFRENTEGLYVGAGGIFKKGTPDEIAINESINTRKGVERIVRHAFAYARQHGRKRVTLCDKSNVLRYAHDLWQRVFAEVGEEHSEIERDHMYVDALCMDLVRCPERFDVIVTSNMFGDIITDLGAQLTGGLGLAASANVNPGVWGLYEPVHGSAPDIAGKDQANPIGAVVSAALMADDLGLSRVARRMNNAARMAALEGQVTVDLGGTLGTEACGEWIAKRAAEDAALL